MLRALLPVSLLCLGLAGQEGPVRLEKREPDGIFEFRPRFRAPHQRPLSLVLGGGSAKGLAHVGVLEGLGEAELPPAAITGTSAGALVGAFRVSGLGGGSLRRIFQVTDFTQEVFDTSRRSPGMSFFEEQARKGMTVSLNYRPEGWELLPGEVSGRAATQALITHLSRAAAFSQGDFARLQVPLCVVTTNLTQGRLQAFTEGDLVKAVRASMSLPGVFRPVTVNRDQLVDGFLVQNLPVREARRRMPEHVHLAVNVTKPWERLRATTPLELAMRSLSLSIDEMTRVSEESSDLVLRPDMTGVDDFEFRAQADALADRGRAALEAVMPALEALVYGPEGEQPVSGRAWMFSGHQSTELEGLARECLPPGRPWKRRDLYRFLRLAQGRGLCWEAEARPGDLLVLHLTPPPRIRSVSLDVPLDWRAWVVEQLRIRGLEAGGAFRAPALAEVQEAALVEGLFRRRPLVDVRGTAFDPATGRLVLRLREMPLTGVTVAEKDLRPSAAASLGALFETQVRQPLSTVRLMEALHRAEQDLNLQDLAVGLTPEGEGWRLHVAASDLTRAQVNGAVAYETTWGFHGEVEAWMRDLMVKGNEWRFRGGINRVQQQGVFSFRAALPNAPSFGAFLELGSFRQKLDRDLVLTAPKALVDAMPDLGDRFAQASLHCRDLSLGLFHRVGQAERGLLEVQWQRRWGQSIADRPFLAANRQDAVIGSLEWDNLDRHTEPTEGLLARLRVGQGRTEGSGLLEQGPLARWAYVATRGLLRDVVGPVGLDLGLESGLGSQLPLDRWYILGGNASFIGTPSTRFLVSNFAFARLGLPISLHADLLGRFRLVPRLDLGRIGDAPRELGRGARALGAGLILQGTVGSLHVEAGWGHLQTRGADGGPLRKDSQFNILVGTRPFDIWQRK